MENRSGCDVPPDAAATYSPLPHQPFEMIRTRPYHYRAYNLNAMIVRPHPAIPD